MSSRNTQSTQALSSPRHPTRTIHLGGLSVGGDAPVRIQSMTNTDTRDPPATMDQIHRLADAGCEIVRLAVPDQTAAGALPAILADSPVPLVADIHFDYRLALAAVESGMHGLRINPGNIGSSPRINRVVDAARTNRVPIRIGVNSGSVEKSILQRFGGPTPQALVQSALHHVRLLEGRGFTEYKISLKSSSVAHTLAAYRLLAEQTDCPLHIGITEAGTLLRGTVKSSLGIGLLLAEGLGDTLRVSLTADPVDEVLVAWEILRGLGLRSRGPELISCPTCGRTEIDLFSLARQVEDLLRPVPEVFTVAVMGCAVNGPGEAKEADIGLAGGRGSGVIFKKGRVVRRLQTEDEIMPAFKAELAAFLDQLRGKQPNPHF
ncbi:flavodoxin-dependent (E)-4-hydroxy-3-methylbut-2-enyl-diphosphate synthase [Desulfovermiculus halophilus]|uniref:flavodoxin-dependent (E)-4-hydroxy-3-methylbut-2-enyl-diphosphate synthase n=1 Tax=Desulfovermiculus halophilus TaxID=339722 RepID=UPI0006860708|nr:flavodoxin-dependent (E)-4-hydroxy-3-methylbut-2-enyl-diphosphate synthase [Desulfovermiculus halophilus]